MFRRAKPAPSKPPPRSRPDWRSYDAVAEEYARVRVPAHEAPARDLVAALDPSPGTRVLDVGTGPGLAVAAALERLGGEGAVVGVDLSAVMARLASDAGVPAVVGAAIDLPFRDATFDSVMAAFVVHLVPRHETALFDMTRVLRSGGRLGLATWVNADDEFTRTWREIAESYATKDMLRDARHRAAPWADHFSDPGRIDETLRGAGLRDVTIDRRTYRSTASISDYLAGRETTVLGRFLRDMLGERLWERFREQVDAEFRRRFRDPIGDTNEVLLTVATKPA